MPAPMTVASSPEPLRSHARTTGFQESSSRCIEAKKPFSPFVVGTTSASSIGVSGRLLSACALAMVRVLPETASQHLICQLSVPAVGRLLNSEQRQTTRLALPLPSWGSKKVSESASWGLSSSLVESGPMSAAT